MNDSNIKPGYTLDDRFLIIEVTGNGAMATVFRATDLLTAQDVAIKVPFPEFENSPAFISRFAQEGRIGEQFDHPYLLKFIPMEHRSRPYLVTEYLHGISLARRLKKLGPMGEKDALVLAGRICEALAHMHGRGVIHRDLKPQNVMICLDGTIRVLDFGISKATKGWLMFPGFAPAIGTPEYMAPEQVRGRCGDERTDIYTLGVMLYEMVTGEIPFADECGDEFRVMNARLTGDPVAPRIITPGLSEGIEEIILHAMERKPAGRYRSALAMKDELDNPDRVSLTGRYLRLQAPAPWKLIMRKVLLAGTALSAVILGFAKLILMIMRRGP